jgi:hypothetical protein
MNYSAILEGKFISINWKIECNSLFELLSRSVGIALSFDKIRKVNAQALKNLWKVSVV